MNVFERRAQVGKVSAFGVNISRWLNGEAISTANATPDSKITISATTSDTTSVNFLAEGVAIGLSTVEIEVTTPTRSRCFKVGVQVVEGC